MSLCCGDRMRGRRTRFSSIICLKGMRNGAELYVVDPRRTSSAQWAEVWLGLDVGSDIALANAMAARLSLPGLANERFIEHATSGFEAYKAQSKNTPWSAPNERPAFPPTSIRRMRACLRQSCRARQLCWTLGITEHHNAVDNVSRL